MCKNVLNESKISEQLPEGRVVVLNTIHSTNQYIIDNLQYIQSGDVFVTQHQTQGRGRHGKIWFTANGKSLCLSIYWKLYQKLSITVLLSLIISFAVSKVLKKFGVSQIKIKWPNDIYVYNKKLAGILIEIIRKNNTISHVVIGIGINISICTHVLPSMKIKENWIDLKSIGITPNNNLLVVNLVNFLRWELKQFENNKYISFIHYQKIMDYLYNKSVVLCIDHYTEQHNGIALGINPYNGALLIMDQSGMIRSYLADNISIYVN